jgi:molybdate transport system permease protein
LSKASSSMERLLLLAAGGLLVAFLAAPLVALVATSSLHEFVGGLLNPLVWPALRLSLLTTSASMTLTVLLGTPLAWVIARGSGRLVAAVETLVHIPMVMPPAVAGVALLLTFGRRGMLSGWAYPEGTSVTFTTTAVVFAELFVSAPFFVQAGVSAFRRVDPSLLAVARSFGAHPLRIFLRVAIPLSLPALVAGAAMAWARALGEFGATLMFAGNLQGETQTLPLAIYTVLESDLASAQALSIILVAVAFVLLLSVRAMQYRSARRREGRP